MKLIFLTIISFLLLPSFSFTSQKVFVQNISIDYSLLTIEIDLKGSYEVAYSSSNEVTITTILDSKGASEEVLDYAIQVGYFDLVSKHKEKEGHLVIKEKRINNAIYTKGERLKANRKYRIVLPAGVCVL